MSNETTAWLIERDDLPPGGTHYFAFGRVQRAHHWTRNVQQAARFKTRAAAEAECGGGHTDGPLKVREHVWVEMPR